MAAVVARFGPFAWDLAATREKAKAPKKETAKEPKAPKAKKAD